MVHTLSFALSTVGCTGRMQAVLGHERWLEVADGIGCSVGGGVAGDHDGTKLNAYLHGPIGLAGHLRGAGGAAGRGEEGWKGGLEPGAAGTRLKLFHYAYA